MKTPLLLVLVALAALAGGPAATRAQGDVQHFSKEGLSFDYPVAWTLTDSSSAELQRLTLRREGLSNIIMVFAQREPVETAEQLAASRESVTLPYVEGLARKLGLSRAPKPEESRCVKVGERFAVGFLMAGRVEKEPTTAEVYTIAMGQRLLHLVHIRSDRDAAQGVAVWETLIGSLQVAPPATPSPEAERIDKVILGGVLNGKARKKPEPDYPPIAKAARATGKVNVRIVVDEKGDVIFARAVSGHPLLHQESLAAARRAKFSPTTVCGQPVRVIGVITYNFILD